MREGDRIAAVQHARRACVDPTESKTSSTPLALRYFGFQKFSARTKIEDVPPAFNCVEFGLG